MPSSVCTLVVGIVVYNGQWTFLFYESSIQLWANERKVRKQEIEAKEKGTHFSVDGEVRYTARQRFRVRPSGPPKV